MRPAPFLHNHWFIVFLSLCGVVLTFPDLLNYPGTGVDKAYIWAYNDLFLHNFSALKELVFTYGPLGFLKFPLPVGFHWEIGFAFLFLIRFVQIFLFIATFKESGKPLRIWTYIAALLLLKVTSFDLVFASIMLCCSLLYGRDKNRTAFLPGLLLASVALYIKFSIGMLSFAVFFGYVGWAFVSRRITMRQMLFLVLPALLFVWVSGFVLSGDVLFPVTYITNALRISSAYAASLSLHPESAKGYLFTGLGLLVPGYLLIQRKQWKPLVFVPLVCGLFIVWKHSIVREEAWHIFLLVQFIMMMWLFLIVTSERRKFILTISAIACMGCLWLYTRDLGGVRKLLVHSNNPTLFFKQCQAMVSCTPYLVDGDPDFQALMLPADIRNRIGAKTVDVYPWDLNYIPVNKLNWHPRPALQAIDFNPWLDKKSAEFYRGNRAPEFVIWHRTEDYFGRELGALEGRYQLSSEPYTVDAVLGAYEPVFVQHGYTIYQKRKPTETLPGYKADKTIEIHFGEMVQVPRYGGLLRAGIHFSLNTKGKIASALYKEPAIFIRYKWPDGTEYDYNILRHNSPSGVWIQPFVSSMVFPDWRLARVDSIGFYNTDQSLFKENVSITWLHGFLPPGLKMSPTADTIPYQRTVFDDETVSVPPFGYTNLSELAVDSLPAGKVEIIVSAKARQPQKAKPRLVLSIDKDTQSAFWTAAYTDGYLPCRERWGTIHLRRDVDLGTYPGHTLKIYFWNEGPVPYDISSVRIRLRTVL